MLAPHRLGRINYARFAAIIFTDGVSKNSATRPKSIFQVLPEIKKKPDGL